MQTVGMQIKNCNILNLAAPTIDTNIKNKFVAMEGERVELICPIKGTPTPNITWVGTHRDQKYSNKVG